VALGAAVVGLVAMIGLAGAAAAASLGPLRVRGNRIVTGSGRGHPIQLRGVNRSGLEYACIQGYGFFESPHPYRIDTPAMVRAMKSWDINSVRVPLNEDCWLGLGTRRGLGGRAYRRIVGAYVRELHRAGLYVILDLHWNAPGRARATSQLPMADRDHSPAFWRSVARAFRRDRAVVFDLFNEPYGIGWGCWLHGCRIRAQNGKPAYRAAGMQSLVSAVRSTGARQPLLLGGLNYSAELGGFIAHAPRDPRHQLIAAEHNYGGLSPCGAPCQRGVLSTERRYPVLFSELGETDCKDGYINRMMAFADRRGIGYLGWAWDAGGGWSCDGGPSLISSYSGTPTAFGIGLRDHLRQLARR
jgi:endoglucanase